MTNRIQIAAIVAGLGLLGLGGCLHHGVYPHGPAVVGGGVVYVRSTPPPPRRVVIPPRPSSLAVWIDGYWSWTGVRFVWVDGFWNSSPPRSQVWTRDQWIHTDRGWYRRPGRWSPDSHGRGR